MFVRELNLSNWLTGYASIVYRSMANLVRWFFKKLFCRSSHPFGRYRPETGREWKKTAKNRPFFEVLLKIKGVNVIISTKYFNTS